MSFFALGLAAPSLSHAEPPAERLLESRGTAPDYDPNIYEASLDTEVTYDDSVAQAFDDGYGPRAFSQFEAALAPHGTWIDDPSLGRVWIPAANVVGSEFVPYATNGTWVLTEYGWTWESRWPWGWAPFHYGRWTMLKNRGWAWVPGTLWGPAWVAWRAGHSYIGWAPLPPRGIHLGRPIGTRSPWRFVRADALGAASQTYVALRVVPSIFGRTAALSNSKEIRVGDISIRTNVGPIGKRWCRDRVPASLETAAPNARPRLAIKPRAGAPRDARPWIAAGVVEQTPLARWPSRSGS